ncbi:hypothetical protein PHPALM_30430 [Phytophthora palmivora]|uniref:Uncharacterized protein n=1 Tax=Phytophthora palmivora TaxID=4796 RepID=A0A2P4X545_9STRA|nr:hypothetical protein PHPALM_30430 [Phytophthora palmivora]
MPKGLSVDFTYVKPEYAQATIDVNQDRVEEAYEQTKTGTGNDNAVDVLDTDHFMEALWTERLFGPLEADDVNLCKEPIHDEDIVDDGEDALDVPSADHSDYKIDGDSYEDF